MSRKSRKRRKNQPICRISAIFVSIAIILIAAFLFVKLDNAVRPSAQMQAETLSKHTAYEIITDTISQYAVENDCSYSKFSTVVYDEYGNVSSVEALVGNINLIQSELAGQINENLCNSENTTAEIPFGNISGLYLLAGKGPDIKVEICPVGTADVKLKSTFDSAGINQSRHRISAEIQAEMTASFPLYSFNTKVNFEYLIAETIIVGDVPEYSARTWAEIT